MQAIELCVNRFDDDTKTAFLDLYTKMEAPVEVTPPEKEPVNNPNEFDEIPF
jgi:hypothetical protein